MKTIFFLILFVGLSILGFGQNKSDDRGKKPVKIQIKLPKNKKDIDKDKETKHFTVYSYNECPKCGFRCTDKGLCPHDKCKLKYRQFSKEGFYDVTVYQNMQIDCKYHPPSRH